MDIFHIDRETGEFLGKGLAEPHPFKDGEWGIPAHAVTDAPPKTGEHEAAVWLGDGWSLVPDHRDETWWNGDDEPVVIETLGDPTEQGLSPDEPPPPPPGANDVRAEADRRMVVLTGARDSRHKDLLIQNGTREAVRLLRIGNANWTSDQALRAQQLEELEAGIDAIRAASDVLEAMPTVPADFADDRHWP